jgi:cytochrome o ubiquinol oxidase subunit 2
VLTLAFAWWYRASNAAVAWTGSHDLDPARRLPSNLKPIRIEVVSLDWKWLVIYPDFEVATLNQIIVPAGVPIELQLTSTNVMNAFWVPQLGSQIYTMPGMTTRLNLLAARAE